MEKSTITWPFTFLVQRKLLLQFVDLVRKGADQQNTYRSKSDGVQLKLFYRSYEK